MRGRNRGGKGGGGGGNPLHRGYESNGPDVKIRGTAQHIVEKYAQLARDAQASGDHVLAESYLQHAEHYFRMIAAYQAQFVPQQGEFGEGEEDNREEDEEGAGAAFESEGGFNTGRNQQHNQQRFRNDRNEHQGGYRQRHGYNGRSDNADQPQAAFPVRDEIPSGGAQQRGDDERQRRFDKRERFNRPRFDKNAGSGEVQVATPRAANPGNEMLSTEDAGLPSFLTRSRRRAKSGQDSNEGEEGANNNHVPAPPASSDS
jgi:hypothetical protein